MKWSRLKAVRTPVVAVSGFASLAAAAFLVSMALGWAAVGVSLLTLAYLTDDSASA